MSGTIVILEGSEQCGKTTLARKIQDRYKAFYLHGSRPLSGDFLRYHWDMFESAVKLAAEGHIVVIDRHVMSHKVYGDLFDKGTAYDTNRMAKVMKEVCELFGVNFISILCDPDREFDANLREEMYSDADGRISEAFRSNISDFSNAWDSSIIVYNWHEDPSGETVLEKIKEVMNGSE